MNNSFNSPKNKELLYNLLLNNQLFNGLSESFVTIVREKIEATISQIETNMSTLSLIDKNKRFVQLMIQNIQQLKQTPQKNEIVEIYTSQDIRSKNLKEFENNFLSIKNEFEDTLRIKKPEEPTFNDSTSDEPLTNMEDMLAKLTAERNLDLQTVKYDESLPSIQHIKKEVSSAITKGVTINEKKNTVYEQNENINLYRLLTEVREEQKQLKLQQQQIQDTVEQILSALHQTVSD